MSAHEKPMLFSGPMVRAILDGSKTQTRRVIKSLTQSCPYPVGTRVWVRETWAAIDYYDNRKPSQIPETNLVYRAGGPNLNGEDRQTFKIDGRGKWRPSIFMPKWAARIWLEITDVRVQRLQDISEEDAMAEGVDWRDYAGLASKTARKLFADLWESINGKDSWHANPWVWVYEFKRAEGGAE